ncbi:unnamed protein product [Pleuronectes platessa]|uniref:Nose resistant-to-fluoxetine protein N-terminal domain-containing protein n=1 Tax=Pleuronectes platessa TaxID=8262 RepID=A0A9N7V9M9_PLEPL|nr:unnamed protein product [Pleuronectes platessa]
MERLEDHDVIFLLSVSSLELETTEALNVTKKCEEDTNTFLWELTQERPLEYAVHMYDAFGKMGSNVEGGNVNQPGSQQQCQSAHGSTFSGQYCQVFRQQETVRYFVGICVPDSCKEEDVEMLVLYGRLQIGQTSLIPPFPSILVNQTAQALLMTHCLSNTVSPDAFDVTCLFVCSVMVAIPLAATLLTAIIRWKKNREVSPSLESSSINTGLNLYGTLKSNGSSGSERNGGSLEERGGGYSSLNGIRVLSLLFWIICLHCHPSSRGQPGYKKHWEKAAKSNPLHLMASAGPIALAVDSFFAAGMSDGSSSELTCSPERRRDGGARPGPVGAVSPGRGWSALALVSSRANASRGAGPSLPGAGEMMVGVVQGHVARLPTVFGTVDMPEGLLSARSLLNSINRADGKLSISMVASYLFNRIKRIQPLHLFILCFTTGLTSLVRGGPYWFQIMKTMTDCKTYWWGNVLLISNILPTPSKCIPWAWYLSLDFQCYAATPLLLYFYKLNKGVFAAVAGGLMLMTIASGAITTALLQLPVFQPLSGTAQIPLALAVTWIIVACEEGYGGFIKSFLSLGFWLPLSNISFACYLSHPIFIIIYMGLQETPIHYTDLNFMYIFLGHLVLTLVVSYVLTVLIEKTYLLKYSRT